MISAFRAQRVVATITGEADVHARHPALAVIRGLRGARIAAGTVCTECIPRRCFTAQRREAPLHREVQTELLSQERNFPSAQSEQARGASERLAEEFRYRVRVVATRALQRLHELEPALVRQPENVHLAILDAAAKL